ncbi:Integrator complex subunit 2, partial [Coemansia erecta]
TEAESTKPKLIPQDVWLDPLVLFRSDSRVFESPGLTDILLTVLSEFLVLSRTSMRRIHSLRQKDSCTLKPPHIVALVQLQESSALQILIELASLSRNDAVRSLIYAFIHARFLEQRVVQKLVHFQAYELSAIDDMVKHVPSMHSCSEFIPEMLMQSLPRLQLFSVRLAASITSNYPIVANEGMTKEVILPHIQTTLMQMAGTVAEEQLAISNAMLEAVIRINSVFTLIRQDCIRLVNAVRNAAIEKAQPALQDNQQPQQCDFIQSIAKWVGSCDKVLEIIGDVNLDTGRPQYTQIEDVNADEFVSAVELSAKSRENNKHI